MNLTYYLNDNAREINIKNESDFYITSYVYSVENDEFDILFRLIFNKYKADYSVGEENVIWFISLNFLSNNGNHQEYTQFWDSDEFKFNDMKIIVDNAKSVFRLLQGIPLYMN